MKYSTYAIYNKKRDKIYIGHTSNLNERLKRHNNVLNNKISSFTSKNKGNWIPVYTENFSTRAEAVKREKQLKSFRGREFVKSIIKN